MRNSDDKAILIRSNEILIEMLDTMLTENYIPPEMLVSYQENLLKCKRAVNVIKMKEEYNVKNLYT